MGEINNCCQVKFHYLFNESQRKTYLYIIQTFLRKTILMAYPKMKKECEQLKSSYNCYKLLGFDVMLDDNFKPWVLEVFNNNSTFK